MSQENEYYWQSFADLALGLLSVFALVLVMILWTQSKDNKALSDDKSLLKQQTEYLTIESRRLQSEAHLLQIQKKEIEKKQIETDIKAKSLEIDQGKFALELIDLIDSTWYVIQSQDGAEDWLRMIFLEEGCPLTLEADGSLRLTESTSTFETSSLYESGQIRLNAQGAMALAQCKQSLLRLARCLGPHDETDPLSVERTKQCLGPLRNEEPPALSQLRLGLEALILQGNTDRVPLRQSTPNLETPEGNIARLENRFANNFFSNAHLGSERARQALGYLLLQLQEYDGDQNDALGIMMAKLRIESPSFGRYQAGPLKWREGHCSDNLESCDEARNLSLRLRWKKQELRKPYEMIREKVCMQLKDQQSSLSKGIIVIGNYQGEVTSILKNQSRIIDFYNKGILTSEQLFEHFSCNSLGLDK